MKPVSYYKAWCFFQTARRYKPEVCNLHSEPRENFSFNHECTFVNPVSYREDDELLYGQELQTCPEVSNMVIERICDTVMRNGRLTIPGWYKFPVDENLTHFKGTRLVLNNSDMASFKKVKQRLKLNFQRFVKFAKDSQTDWIFSKGHNEHYVEWSINVNITNT
jgi:hypothetical protein